MKYSTRRKIVRLPLKTILVTGIILLLILGGVIYFFFDPTSSQLFPKCGFFVVTGYKCPGCGMQRMMHALLNGDVIGAFRYNAYLMTVFPLAFFLLMLEYFRNRCQRIYRHIPYTAIAVGYLILTLLWWVLRNVFNW